MNFLKDSFHLATISRQDSTFKWSRYPPWLHVFLRKPEQIFSSESSWKRKPTKRPESGGRLGSFWFSTRPSADKGTECNLHHALKSVMHKVLRALHRQGVDYNQCLCLPKAELKTKTNPKSHHFVAVWVRFGFQLDSLEKSVPACMGKRVTGTFRSLLLLCG